METTFSQRLTQACDDNPLIPDYGHGRQVTIANKLGISQEAVRKYFSGDAVPRRKKMEKLAEYLGVSIEWLSLGITPTLDRTAKKEMVRVVKGAIHMLAGMIALEGGNFAFPTPDDTKKYIDLYSIKDGQKVDFHVSVGRKINENERISDYEFVIPREYDQVYILGLVYLQGGEIEWINTPKSIIDKHFETADNYFKVTAQRDNGKYSSGNDKWLRFKTIGEIL